ncbi:MAG: hypothetical protein RLZZ74_2753, partial [Cyanobacteriota bacterium]
YFANRDAEILVATTEDSGAADFNLFADDYYGQAIIG